MRRVIWTVLILGLFWGCGGGKHPRKIFIDPTMNAGSVERIAVFHFASSLHHADDPDERAPMVMDELFLNELNKRGDYLFVAPRSVEYTLDVEGLTDQYKKFIEDWRTSQTIDVEFLQKLGGVLQVDGVLIGVVDLWQKDEVDVQETSTPTTYVGATITILNTDGKMVFQASDEDYLEGNRSEERTVMRSGSGGIYSDPGATVHRAPPHEEVAIKVVRALVASIPAR